MTMGKRLEFMEKLKSLNLTDEIMNEIKELADSMEAANRLGETELGLAYKNEIKKGEL